MTRRRNGLTGSKKPAYRFAHSTDDHYLEKFGLNAREDWVVAVRGSGYPLIHVSGHPEMDAEEAVIAAVETYDGVTSPKFSDSSKGWKELFSRRWWVDVWRPWRPGTKQTWELKYLDDKLDPKGLYATQIIARKKGARWTDYDWR